MSELASSPMTEHPAGARGERQRGACGSRLVLFDLDGALVDSVPGIWASIRVAVAGLGLPAPTTDQLRSMVGPPLWEGFAAAFGLVGDDVDRAVLAYRAHYGAGAMFEALVYPGIAELPGGRGHPGGRHQQARGVRAADPGARRPGGRVRHRARRHLVREVRHKEQVVAAALAAHPDGERPVLVGDHAQDVLGARVHGLPCIGAGWGPALPGELAAAGAAVVVGTPAEVPGALAML